MDLWDWEAESTWHSSKARSTLHVFAGRDQHV